MYCVHLESVSPKSGTNTVYISTLHAQEFSCIHPFLNLPLPFALCRIPTVKIYMVDSLGPGSFLYVASVTFKSAIHTNGTTNKTIMGLSTYQHCIVTSIVRQRLRVASGN